MVQTYVYGFGAALLVLQLVYYPGVFGVTIPETAGGIAGVLMCLLVMMSGAAGCICLYLRNKAKEQQIWIDRNQVYMRIEKRVKKTVHTYTYKIEKADEASVDERFIHVRGIVRCIDETEHSRRQNTLPELSIPRCFTNEQNVFGVLGVS